ncbi:hypothetical protein LTR50_005788 [Elasticomyces elasticus]|nr:hypothetical protein LTR50_005788 [Elasticomyces elasticus]
MAHSAPFPAMTTSRDTPNPLRPYYIPPSIGLPPEPPTNSSTLTFTSATQPSPSTARPSFGSSARDILSDLDYSDSIFSASTPSLAEISKKIMDQAIWKYTSVLLAQPFDVAKTILQVRLAAGTSVQASTRSSRTGSRSNSVRHRASRHHDVYLSDSLHGDGPPNESQTQPYPISETDSDSDEASYFTSTAPAISSARYQSRSPSRRRSRRGRTPPSLSHSPTPTHTPPSHRNHEQRNPHELELRRSDSILEVLAQLWQHSGATGIWKATNTTFIYNVLAKTIESWTRSLLSAILNLPDPGALIRGPGDAVAGAVGGIDIVDSPSPFASLGVAVVAAGITGLMLAPLDIVRTRTAELFLKLPLETVLRRGQIAVLQDHHTKTMHNTFRDRHTSSASRAEGTEMKMLVTPGPYKGVFGTMWSIVGEEGVREQKAMSGPLTVQKKTEKGGQGVQGLWRGWRVGMWGLAGVWGAAALGGGSGGEF